MTTAPLLPASAQQLPTDPKTGLTLPLRTSLASSDLAKHKAMVAVELEVLAKKFDRFGWDRDRGSAAQDGMIRDWIEILQDFPLDEVRDACRKAVIANPDRMPNEGHILAEIMKARKMKVMALPPQPDADPPRPPITEEDRARRAKVAAEILGRFAQDRCA